MVAAMEHHHQAVQNLIDAGASAGSLIFILSYWAEVLAPILTCAIGLLTLAFWAMRLWMLWKTGKAGKAGEAGE